MRTAKILASLLLLVASAAGGQDNKPPKVENKQPKVDLRGGLEAQLVTIARQGQWTITAQVRLTNNSPNTAFVLMVGIPTAVDDAGMTYGMLQGAGVSGFAFCRGPAETQPQPHTCVVPTEKYLQFLFPLQGYDVIDPGKSGLVNISVSGSANGPSGGKARLAFELAYRMVKPEDMDKDPDVPEADRRKRVQISPVHFPPQEVVTSSIKFDEVK